MSNLALRDLAKLSEDARAALERTLAGLETLGDLVAWCARQEPPAAIGEVVIQDEYTHDVVVLLPDRRALVFDTT